MHRPRERGLLPGAYPQVILHLFFSLEIFILILPFSSSLSILDLIFYVIYNEFFFSLEHFVRLRSTRTLSFWRGTFSLMGSQSSQPST